jgi:hypothetical protein
VRSSPIVAALVLGAEHTEPDTITFAPASHHRGDVVDLDAAVDLDLHVEPRSSIIAPQRRIFSSAPGMNRWPPKPG